jgi:hypothetical protein
LVPGFADVFQVSIPNDTPNAFAAPEKGARKIGLVRDYFNPLNLAQPFSIQFVVKGEERCHHQDIAVIPISIKEQGYISFL